MEKIKIFACNSAQEFTKKICDCLNIEMGKINSFKFKNDNNFVQLQETVREQDVYIVQTVTPPVNERIMELLITIDAAKRASAGRINVVLPYFPYSRSDKKDQPRISITAKLMAQLIQAAGANRVITCDLHNPSIQAYFDIQCDMITAQYTLENYYKEKNIQNIVIVATDAGSSKKAYKYSNFFKCPIALIDKRRIGNQDKVEATNVIGEVKGKNAIIFDDEIDTGGSIIQAAEIIRKHGAKEIYAGCTHGILSDNAVEKLQKSEFKEIVITDTVPLTKEKQIDKIKIVSVAPLFAQAIKRINEAKPLGELYN